MDLVLSLDKLQTPVRFHVDLNSELVSLDLSQSRTAWCSQNLRNKIFDLNYL